jgi:hypothetical protein
MSGLAVPYSRLHWRWRILNHSVEFKNGNSREFSQICGRSTTQALTFWPVVRVASGNFLEMYDFQVFGYYAAAIARTFFPSGNEFASLMLSLMTFGAGFLMPPLGAIVLGAYIDHRGRRNGLLLTLGLMAIGTISIACTPRSLHPNPEGHQIG